MLSLTLPLMLGACQTDSGPHAEAKALIASQCAACHIVPGVRTAVGRTGPTLDGIAKRQLIAGRFPNNRDVLVRWLMHPQAMVPGTAMPEVGLNETQAIAVAKYLETLN